MTYQEGPENSVHPYPSPPSYLWKEFIYENCNRLQNLRNNSEVEQSPRLTSLTPLNIPTDLEYLQPPPPPPNRKWRLFGQLHDLSDQLPSLEDHGIKRLGPIIPSTSAEKDAHANRVFELKKLSKSLVLNFLELSGILGTNPNDATEKLTDLQTIFYNMHQQINEWRPHQTREALISMLQNQLEKTRNETRALQEITENVRKTLVGFTNTQGPIRATDGSHCRLKATDRDGSDNVLEMAAYGRFSELWTVLDEAFGQAVLSSS